MVQATPVSLHEPLDYILNVLEFTVRTVPSLGRVDGALAMGGKHELQ